MKRTTRIISVTAAVATVAIGAGATYAVAAQSDTDGSVSGDDLRRATEAALAETGGGEVTDVERDGLGYDVEVRMSDGSEIDVELAPDFTVLAAIPDEPDGHDDGDDGDENVDGAARKQAEQAALAETGQGTVTDVERDGLGYDVEVRMSDGSEVDVDLNDTFDVIGVGD